MFDDRWLIAKQRTTEYESEAGEYRRQLALRGRGSRRATARALLGWMGGLLPRVPSATRIPAWVLSATVGCLVWMRPYLALLHAREPIHPRSDSALNLSEPYPR